MTKISFVTSTFNEEKNLPGCLESIKDLADEIVVVDGTSTDKTVEIAKSYGAKIKITDNPKIFLINRQKAIDMATGSWLLNLDADERATPELVKEIREIVGKNENINGYFIPRKNWFLGRFLMKGGQYPDYQLRLYRNGKVHFELKDVHEQAIVEGEKGYLKEAMLHYPYKSFANYLFKWQRYNDVFASQIKEELSRKSLLGKIFGAVDYLIIKPAWWFFWTLLRHKGIYDLWSGVIFSFFSALRFPASYIKSFN